MLSDIFCRQLLIYTFSWCRVKYSLSSRPEQLKYPHQRVVLLPNSGFSWASSLETAACSGWKLGSWQQGGRTRAAKLKPKPKTPSWKRAEGKCRVGDENLRVCHYERYLSHPSNVLQRAPATTTKGGLQILIRAQRVQHFRFEQIKCWKI